MSEDEKDCGCWTASIKCFHFDDDGSSLQIVHVSDEDKLITKTELNIDLPSYCIQYTSSDSGPVCTGDDYDDEAEALDVFEELVECCLDHPEK